MSLTQDIRDFALDLGYSGVGITPADGFPTYIEDLKSRYDMYVWYIEGPRQPILGANPRNIMPSAKSIVSLVYDYSKKSFPQNLLGKIGRLYLARCYNAPEYRINGARPQLMREFLKKNGCQIGQNIFVPERLTAARAGIVTYGKNTFAFTKAIGSFILLSSFIVDAELDYDNPTIEMKCPSKCTACIEACPTNAIYEPLKIDPRRCIAFNTFWTQDGVPGNKSHIPPELREKMGTWIHGCDICQEVCPRNKNKLKTKLPPDEFLEKIAEDFDITKLLNLSEDFYIKRVQPLMYNYIKDKKYFQRNAAIALGNLGDPAFIP
ncbi:MAG TPA: 4Fe-4S double cluster binding domain-containing protein, partial [Thermodesulfobacteriota bacterium]|nr:4Fe-4S double cluster binding domain-containing protein [Thermodesulfobacteriota bacterium]